MGTLGVLCQEVMDMSSGDSHQDNQLPHLTGCESLGHTYKDVNSFLFNICLFGYTSLSCGTRDD